MSELEPNDVGEEVWQYPTEQVVLYPGTGEVKTPIRRLAQFGNDTVIV